jgi:short-subunit dehydrogenase
MLAQKSGHILFMNSMAALITPRFDTPYSTAKRALSGFADSLRRELIGSGLTITSIFPGRVDTPLIGHLRFSWISPKIPPEAVARATLKAIRSHKPNVIVLPFQTLATYYSTLFLPVWIKDRLSWAFHIEGWEN